MEKPIIHAFFVCYNEANILPHLLRYYLSFCEKVTILDNNSTDNSVEIVNSFKNTEVIPYTSDNSFNDHVHITLKNNVWKSSVGYADYVILGDTDEFLYHEDIIGFINESRKKGVTVFKPEGYHMIADTDLILSSDDNIFERVKEGVRTPVLDKMMMFDCNKITNINYNYGCHYASPVGEVVVSTDPSLKMLHYKFLGLKDYLEKNKIRAERLSDFNKVNGFGLYYMYTPEEHIVDYQSYLSRRVKILK
jgi:glycosyltransferase involved in cell wall biosynthesis